MNFTDFHFHADLLAGVQALGYTVPTPIQQQAILPVLQGRDVMGLAQTGTGKTAAFALPMLQHLRQRTSPRVRALVVAPTRELAAQLHATIVALGQHTALRSITLYGGVSMTPQIQQLRRGTDIVVACPGRLLDHLRQGTLDLMALEVVVLDEADRMLDMGFLPDIRKILQYLPRRRQSLLFAATMPEDVRRLACDLLHNPVTVEIGQMVPTPTVSQALYPVAPQRKTALLLALLRHTELASVLIFTRTKHRAKQVAQQLSNAGYGATSLHGNLSQKQRQAALDGFRKGSYKILVATDIAARGIDVASISHVINYDMPDTTETYTHRIGRTGRAAKIGAAFTLVTRDDAAMVVTLERHLCKLLERRTLPGYEETSDDLVPAFVAVPSSRMPGKSSTVRSFGPKRKSTYQRPSTAHAW